MEIILFLCFVVSFIVTLLLTPQWIRYARNSNLAVRDMNKFKKPIISTAGGVIILTGFIFSILFYIALKTFVFKTSTNVGEIFAILSVLLIMGFIGFLDDVLGRYGLIRWQKPLLCLIAAIPLIVINSGRSVMYVPFVGPVNFGLFYPLLLIPLAISGAANGFNMIGGYNGLQTGLGIIILAALGIISAISGQTWIAILCFCMVASLLAFLIFNKYPAKIFDGNILSYVVGSFIACIAIISNSERAALILFIPFFIELILKARGKMKKESFAIPNKDDSLEKPYNKFYGLEHVVLSLIKKIKPSHKVYEKEIVYSFWILEIILAIIVILLI